MGGDSRQVGGDFLAKPLDPEGPPQHRQPCQVFSQNYFGPPAKIIFLFFSHEAYMRLVCTSRKWI